MSKWKNVRTYMEVNPYTGQPKDEDIANVTGPNVAGTGDDSSVVVVRKLSLIHISEPTRR